MLAAFLIYTGIKDHASLMPASNMIWGTLGFVLFLIERGAIKLQPATALLTDP